MKTIHNILSNRFYLLILLLVSIHVNLKAQYYTEDYLKLGDKAAFMAYINAGGGNKDNKANTYNEEQSEQQGNTLKGPNAKNYKLGNRASSEFYTGEAASQLVQGTNAKNQKSWKAANAQSTPQVISSNPKRMELKGPKAKHYEPWRKGGNPTVF